MNSRTAVLAAVAILSMAHAAKADELGQAPPAPATAQRAFDIPAQPLATALNAFGRQAGLQVSIEASVARGVQAPAVSGTMMPEQALRLLLAGTGIQARFTADGGVLLTRPMADSSGALQLDPVQVQGNFVPPQAIIDNIPPPYAGGQVATGSQLGILGNRGVMDTPFNQTSYTAQKARNQQAQTVRDVLVDDPSIRALWSTGSGSFDAVMIRGFLVDSQNTAFNGLYGIMPFTSTPAEYPERVEVLKGPSAMLNGMAPTGSIGGTINVVPKRAGNEPFTQLTASYSSAGQFGGHADFGRRFGPDKQVGVRFNGLYRAGYASVANNTEKVGLAALGLDFRGERLRLSADLGYQYIYTGGLIPIPTISAGFAVPGVPTTSNNFGQPWADSERKDAFVVGRLEFDIAERLTLYGVVGGRDSRQGQLDQGDAVIFAANGNTRQTPFNGNLYNNTWSAEGGLRGFADTGPIDHEFSLSATTFEREIGSGFANGTQFISNIYAPTFIARPNLVAPNANKTGALTLTSFALADTLALAAKRIQLTLGGRFQRVVTKNFNGVSGVLTSTYDQSAFSPSAALVFKPWENVSVYGNFIEGLQPGTTVGLGFANVGQVFPPFQATQYEVGVKVDWGRFTTTASAFQITQPSTIVDTATNTLNLAGEQRNRGIELNFFGEPAPGVRLLGGAMFLDAVLARTQGGLTDGWRAAGAPDVQLNLATEWDTPFARGLTLNGRVIYTSMQYAGVSSPRQSIPSWVRLDLGARYMLDNVRSPTGSPIAIRFNVENVLDTNYWAAAAANTRLVLGTPRTFRLALTTDF